MGLSHVGKPIAGLPERPGGDGVSRVRIPALRGEKGKI